MKAGSVVSGEARVCPHCKATILKSSTSCPLCRHVLRFGAISTPAQSSPTTCPLLVEGTLAHPGDGDAREYFILLEIRDAGGKLLSRESVGVGAMQRSEKRVFSLRIEMTADAQTANHI
jgi:hypothetical protein